MEHIARQLLLLPTALHAEQEVDARLSADRVLGGPAVLTITAFERRLAAVAAGAPAVGRDRQAASVLARH
jgi:hypothetical protein